MILTILNSFNEFILHKNANKKHDPDKNLLEENAKNANIN
jgi:hypothetical protein